MASKRITVVTGMPGSGKSWVAKEAGKGAGTTALHMDEYRYAPGAWVKEPAATFIARAQAAIAAAPGDHVVVEGAYNDAHDPEQARAQLVTMLWRAGASVAVIEPFASPAEQVRALAGRSLRRACGEEPHGVAVETVENVTRMILKNLDSFDDNARALRELRDAVTAAGGRVAMGSSAEMLSALLSW